MMNMRKNLGISWIAIVNEFERGRLIEMKIGFIGGGNMGSAIIGGMVSSGKYNAEEIFVADIIRDNVDRLIEKYNVKNGERAKKAAENSDILFLAVKPNVYDKVICDIKDFVGEDCIVVSIAAGKSIAAAEKLFGKKVKFVRVMPNTPALVGKGMAAVCGNSVCEYEDVLKVVDIFNCVGRTDIVSEKMMDIVTAVSGSSPAFVYMFIEAMADAAVLGGMSRAQGYEFAAQAVLGSAEMVLKTGMHPGELKDMVCSPGGTTIEAVAELEILGFRSAVIEAVRVCEEKSKSMGKG